VASTLKRNRDTSLVAQAVTGALAAFDLTVARQVPLQQFNVFVVNVISFLGAEATDFF